MDRARRFLLGSCIGLLILLFLYLAYLTFFVSSINNSQSDHIKGAIKIREVLQHIEKEYYKKVDMSDCVELILAKGISACTDPYTRYVPPLRAKRKNEESIGNFGGLGIRIKPGKNKKAGRVVVEDILKGTPAKKSGIQKGDVLIAVSSSPNSSSSISLADIPIEKAIDLLRGAEGTKIFITIRRGSKKIEIPIVRARIKIESVFYRQYQNRIGYIRITEFLLKTPDDFLKALGSLVSSGTKVLIIDVRNNPGGLVDSVVSIVTLFLDRPFESVIYTKQRESEAEPYYSALALLNLAKSLLGKAKEDGSLDSALHELEKYRKLKVIVLTNRYSASASEILAGWFKEDFGATIVGEQTFGKGLVQNIVPLNNKAQLRITTSEYFVGKKKVKIQGIGVIPNVIIKNYPTKINRFNSGKDSDKQLSVAIKLAESLVKK